jgi:hypothetical protein
VRVEFDYNWSVAESLGAFLEKKDSCCGTYLA